MWATQPDSGYCRITVPCGNERGEFVLERVNANRIKIRIGKRALFLTFDEADRVADVLYVLMGSMTTDHP